MVEQKKSIDLIPNLYLFKAAEKFRRFRQKFGNSLDDAKRVRLISTIAAGVTND